MTKIWSDRPALQPSGGSALQPSDRPVSQLLDGTVVQLRVTAQFYLENKGKYILEARGHDDPKNAEKGERETSGPLAPLFICFFLLPLGLPYVNWASQVCYLRSSLWSSDLPLLYFHGLFPSLSFSHRHSGLLFPILTTLHPRLKRWEAQLFGNRGIEISLATSCWTGTVRGIGPPPLASLRPQSPYSGVHLRVSDIFCGQL